MAAMAQNVAYIGVLTLGVKDFPRSARYGPGTAARLNSADNRLKLAGRIDNTRPWTVDEIYAPRAMSAWKSDEIVPMKYECPFKIRIATKCEFKDSKTVTAIYVTNHRPRGYWTDRVYNLFSGI